MTTMNIDEIGKNLSRVLQCIKAGEILVILQANQPIAEIKPLAKALPQLRPFGLCAGEFVVPDNFDEPLPEDIINQFENPCTS